MNIRPEILAVPAYNFKEQEYQIKLDQNESPYDLPVLLKTEILEKFAQLSFNRYPELDAHSIKQNLARAKGYNPQNIVISGGSNILIQALVTAAAINKTVLTTTPNFSLYAMQAQIQADSLVEIPLEDNFDLPTDKLIAELDKSSGIFFMANPAAPTGNLFAKQDILALAKASAKNWLMVIDEAYHEFSDSDYSFLINDYEHIVSLRTMSKAYGLAGVRLGYGLMNAELAKEIQKLIIPFSISIFQEIVAEVILDNSEYLAARIAEIKSEHKRVFASLAKMPSISPYQSKTNFILFKVNDAASFYSKLLEQGVLIRRQDHLFNLENCLRVNIGSKEENNMFLAAVEKIIEEQ